MVTRQDWFSINNIILTMYSTEDDTKMMNAFLKALQVLVPFDMGVYMRTEDINDSFEVSSSICLGAEELFLSDYSQFATTSDYASPLMNMHHSIAYRDTDLLDETRRRNTVFYKEFLEKHGTPYVGGIILAINDILLGEVTLFRSECLGDFTDGELEILNILKDHLNNRLYYHPDIKKKRNVRGKIPQYFEKYNDLNLTEREMEIVDLIISGYGYDDISEELAISINTTKKHVSNIFNKLHVTNRIELIKYFR